MKEGTKITVIVFFLISLGAVMVYSTSAIYASTKYNDYLYFFKRNLMWTFLSLIGLFAGYFISYRILGKCSICIFLLAFCSLFLVFTPLGVEAGGAGSIFIYLLSSLQKL